MKSIVALVDFSDVTAKVMHHALELALQCGAEVFLVHVVPPMPVAVDYGSVVIRDDEDIEGRLAKLQAIQDSMIKQHAVVSTRLLRGPITETLLAHLPALNPGLIVMGSHGHGALYNLVVGSVTQGIIKHADWPVMIIPNVRTKKSETAAPSGSDKTKAEKKPSVVGALGGAMLPP